MQFTAALAILKGASVLKNMHTFQMPFSTGKWVLKMKFRYAFLITSEQ